MSAPALEYAGKLSPIEAQTVSDALALMERFVHDGAVLTETAMARDYLRLKLAARDYEALYVLHLDAGLRVLDLREMFRGTLTHTPLYIREVIKDVLALGTHAMLVCHNHPSGQAKPSDGDKNVTHALRKALVLFDVTLLDHFIVSASGAYSMAERGLIGATPKKSEKSE